VTATTKATAGNSKRDEGVALVLAMCLMLVASVIGGALMLLSQTETYASMNYREMTQARYGAEAALHKTINYLLNTYLRPGSPADPIAAYNVTVSPVTFANAPVVLSSMPSVAANYPVAGTQTDFAAQVQGSLATGGTSVAYTASARLMSMRQVTEYTTGAPVTIQTWQILGRGTTGGTRPAMVEVTAVLETQAVSFNMFGMFATAQTCGALSFGGGVVTDSYDSTSMTMVGGAPATNPTGGNVGTNGNLSETGGSTVNGTLSTPRSGVGHCTSGAVDALTLGGGASVTEGLVQLPQAMNFPTPTLPNPLPPTGNQVVSASDGCSATPWPSICSGAPGNLTLAPTTAAVYGGDVKLTAGMTMHLRAGTYDFNSITLVGNAAIVIDSGPVIMNVVGTGQTNPIDLSGGSVSNMSFVPENFQIVYGGTGGVKVNGGAATALVVYAPNADVALSGGAGIYGSVLGKTIDDHGGVDVHYDRHLPEEYTMSSNTMLTSFSWRKY